MEPQNKCELDVADHARRARLAFWASDHAARRYGAASAAAMARRLDSGECWPTLMAFFPSIREALDQHRRSAG